MEEALEAVQDHETADDAGAAARATPLDAYRPVDLDTPVPLDGEPELVSPPPPPHFEERRSASVGGLLRRRQENRAKSGDNPQE